MAATLDKALPSHPIEATDDVRSLHRSVSESVAYSPPIKTGAFSYFLRRKKQNSLDDTQQQPPPTPPKDTQVLTARPNSREQVRSPRHSPHNSYDYTQGHGHADAIGRSRGSSVSGVIHITHDELDMVVVEPQQPNALETKWASEPFVIIDPAERARRRSEAKRLKEEEERRAVEEEAERQRIIKLNKRAIMEQEIDDQRMRKMMLEQELKRANAERLRKERELKEEEELKNWEAAERKRLDRERRTEEAKRLEELRIGEQRKSEELVRRQEEYREKKEKERKARIKVVEAKIRKERTVDMMTGWLTVQNSDSLNLVWRRRFFKFEGSRMCLYRSPKVRLGLESFRQVLIT